MYKTFDIKCNFVNLMQVFLITCGQIELGAKLILSNYN